MTADSAVRVLIDELHQKLPTAMPAHEVLGQPLAEAIGEVSVAWARGAHYVYVQGRGDRLHAFAAIDGAEDIEQTLAALTQVPANWRWVVTSAASPSLFVAASDLRVGVINLDDSGFEVVAKALPNPGIFIRDYSYLRQEWRKLSSW